MQQWFSDAVAHQQKEVEKRLTSKGGRKKGVKAAGDGQDQSGGNYRGFTNLFGLLPPRDN